MYTIILDFSRGGAKIRQLATLEHSIVLGKLSVTRYALKKSSGIMQSYTINVIQSFLSFECARPLFSRAAYLARRMFRDRKIVT